MGTQKGMGQQLFQGDTATYCWTTSQRGGKGQGHGDTLLCKYIKLLPPFVAICKPSEELSKNVKSKGTSLNTQMSCDSKFIKFVKYEIRQWKCMGKL